jgi:hypothetical protein
MMLVKVPEFPPKYQNDVFDGHVPNARIAKLADLSLQGAGGDGRVTAAAVRGVCRAILEHAATFDALAARQGVTTIVHLISLN